MKNLRNRKTTCLKDENIVCNQTRAKLCKQAFNFKNMKKKIKKIAGKRVIKIRTVFEINSEQMFIKTSLTLKKIRKTLKKSKKRVKKMTTASKSKLQQKCVKTSLPFKI